MTPDERWLAATWRFVRENLPAPPAHVLEIGCGPLGGFVPRLLEDGYRAVGIDPEAPESSDYRRLEFEQYDGPGHVDAIVACTSLHHVADLGEVLGKARAMLASDGALVIVEWARERFDETTARWCFDRLGPPREEHDWLHHCQAEWRESGAPWDGYCHGWADEERLHLGQDILRELDAHFECRQTDEGPYFFAELDGVTEADEQAAIDAGLIRANRIRYVGTPR